MREGLPDGWINIALPQVAELIMGQSPPSTTYNTIGNGLPFFQGKAEFSDMYPSPEKYCDSPGKIAESGDVLISVRAPVGPTNLCQIQSCIGRGLAAIRPKGEVPSKYLLYFFRNIEPWLSQQGTGSTFTAISKGDLQEIELPLAPLSEQRRIIAKLDALLAKVDTSRKRLERIPVILKRFRQAVLAAACEGRLTEDWRKSNMQLIGVASEEGLPDSWRMGTVGEVIEGLKYGTAAKCDFGEVGIGVLRIPNIADGVIDQTYLKYAELPQREREGLALQRGDLLMIRSNGSVSLVGKTALVRDEDVGLAYAGYLIRLRPRQTVVLPEFLNLALASFQVRLQIELEARSTSGVNNINSEETRALSIPLPSMTEQQEIVHRVSQFFALADQTEARYTKAKSHVDRLTQSILAKAFRGELVPQDPNDEPAERLLARLRSEAAVIPAVASNSGTRLPSSQAGLTGTIPKRRGRPRKIPSGG